MFADPCKKDLHLLFTMSLKPGGQSPSLPMAGMYETSANLAGKQPLPLNNADTILPKPHHHKSDKQVLMHQRVQRLNVAGKRSTLCGHREWRYNQIPVMQSPKKYSPGRGLCNRLRKPFRNS